MKINDLEKQLGLKRSQIFYYERAGLLVPRREDNNYREYSEEDLHRLKAIVVLRKLGFPVAEIQSLLEGRQALSDLLPANLSRLEEQARELEAARRLCRDMERQGVTMESFDADRWFETVETEERSGHRFLDILGDAADDVSGAIAFMQKEVGFHGPLYESFILSETGLRRRRPLKLYWLTLGLCFLTAVITGRWMGEHTFWSLLPLYLAIGLTGTGAMLFCGKHIIPGREPGQALALTMAITLAADLCLIPLFLWAGPMLDGVSYKDRYTRLSYTGDDPAGYVEETFNKDGRGQLVLWEQDGLMIVLTSWGRGFQFRKLGDGRWAQYDMDAPVDGVVYTVDEYGPRQYPSRLMLSDGTVVKPLYEARFATGYVPLYAFDISEGQEYTGIEFGVDEAGGLHYGIDAAQYSGTSDWATPPHYNERKAVVSFGQIMRTDAGAEFLAAYRTWRSALWTTEPLLESNASTLGVKADYVLWALYYAPSSLSVHPADRRGRAAEWGAVEFSECIYISEDGEPYYTWQRLCGAEVTVLLTAEEATPALLQSAAATAAGTEVGYPAPDTGVFMEQIPYASARTWKAALPEALTSLGSRTFGALNGPG